MFACLGGGGGGGTAAESNKNRISSPSRGILRHANGKKLGGGHIPPVPPQFLHL